MNKYDKNYSKIIGYGLVEEKEKIWIPLSDKNGICEVDLIKKEVKVIKIFPDEELIGEDLYIGVEKVDDKLIFVPNRSKRIAIYFIDKHLVDYIELRKNIFDVKNTLSLFWNKFQYKKNVYLLGYKIPIIIKVDTEKLKVDYIESWFNKIKSNNWIKENMVYFGSGYLFYHNTVLIPITCSNILIKLNLDSLKTEVIYLDSQISEILGIFNVGQENIWLLVNKKDMCIMLSYNQFDEKTKKIDEIRRKLSYPFHCPIYMNNKIYLFPFGANHIYEIDLKKRKISISEKLENIINIDKKNEISIIAPRKNGNTLKFITMYDFKWHDFNLDTEEYNSYFFKIEDKYLEKYFTSYCEKTYNRDTFLEQKIPLKTWIYMICNDNIKMRKLKKNNNSHACKTIECLMEN